MMSNYRFVLPLFLVLLAAGPAFATETQSIPLFISGQNHFAKNQFSRAQADWRKAADQGDVRAMNALADMYANGTGVKVDFEKALKYWHQAADRGDGDAMYEIAVSYEIARGVPEDRKMWDTWFRKAMDACNEHAAVRVIVMPQSTEAETAKAVDCLKKDAEAGSYRAMTDLASKNVRGQHVDKNPLESTSWGRIALETMQKKADAGDTRAMYYMGRSLFTGVGDSIIQDMPRGLQLCEKAATLGNADAMSWLLTTYIMNDKFQDYNKAADWYKKLIAQYNIRAKKGDVSAMMGLALKYFNPPTKVDAEVGKPIEGAKKDISKAAAWAKKAAALGSREALFLLGFMHEDDHDNPLHDCKKARTYYDKAAAAGDRNAVARLGARAKGARSLVCDF